MLYTIPYNCSNFIICGNDLICGYITRQIAEMDYVFYNVNGYINETYVEPGFDFKKVLNEYSSYNYNNCECDDNKFLN